MFGHFPVGRVAPFARPLPAPFKASCLSDLSYNLHVAQRGVPNQGPAIPDWIHVQGSALRVWTVGSLTVGRALFVVLVLLLHCPIGLVNEESHAASTRDSHCFLGLRARIWTELRYLALVLVAYLTLLRLRAIPSLLILARVKSKRIAKVETSIPA